MRDQNTNMTPIVAETEQVLNHQEVKTGESSTEQKTMETKTKEVIVKAVNLVVVRKYASTSAPITRYVRNGEILEAIGTKNGYHRIKFEDNTIGYLFSKFCEEV